MIVADARCAVYCVRSRLLKGVAGTVKGLDGTHRTWLIHVCVVCFGDFDNIASLAEFCIVAIWSSRVVVDGICVEAIDYVG